MYSGPKANQIEAYSIDDNRPLNKDIQISNDYDNNFIVRKFLLCEVAGKQSGIERYTCSFNFKSIKLTMIGSQCNPWNQSPSSWPHQQLFFCIQSYTARLYTHRIRHINRSWLPNNAKMKHLFCLSSLAALSKHSSNSWDSLARRRLG